MTFNTNQPGDNNNDGFREFLQQLIDCGYLENPASGITKQVIDKGEKSLKTDKQKYIFKKEVLNEYVIEECNRCGSDIPWSEMLEACDNGGYCGWCAYQTEKAIEE